MTSGRGRGADFTLQRYAMLTVDNLLNMERCESCDRELASNWKFCIYCGRPLARSDKHSATIQPTLPHPSPALPRPALPGTVLPGTSLPGSSLAGAARPVAALPTSAPGSAMLPAAMLPAAIRPEPEEPAVRRYDAPFWVGVAMGVLGLVLIIYAAVQIYAANA